MGVGGKGGIYWPVYVKKGGSGVDQGQNREGNGGIRGESHFCDYGMRLIPWYVPSQEGISPYIIFI